MSPACGAQLNWDTFQFRPKFKWKPLVCLQELLYVAFPLQLTIHDTIEYDSWRGRSNPTKCLTAAMALHQKLVQYICSVLLLVSAASALKFDLIAQAESSKRERCVRNFVGKDTLVVVTATVDGYKGDGMVVNLYVRCAQIDHELQRKTDIALQIRDAVGNEYGRPRDVVGESRTVFTSHADAAFDVCFENIVTGCM